jgi:hypothetical protein
MAFFDNSKKKKKIDDVMATMHAPQVPADQPDWFVKGAVDMPSLSIFANSDVLANSWINVEVAAVLLAIGFLSNAVNVMMQPRARSVARGQAIT